MSAILCAVFFLSRMAGLDDARQLAAKAAIGRSQRDSDRAFDDFLATRFAWRR
ncbi:MAG: hypothetical protein VCC67_14785 [Myxococcota bacterium]|jgi:hypothetical protein